MAGYAGSSEGFEQAHELAGEHSPALPVEDFSKCSKDYDLPLICPEKHMVHLEERAYTFTCSDREWSEGKPMLEMLLILVYLVFMFGIPVTTERVWIDSVCSVERRRREEFADRAVAIGLGVVA